VDDNKMITNILDESLKMFGIVAIIADNGKVAVEKFSEFIHKG
jgi:DNA-binding response OmpR family regulator